MFRLSINFWLCHFLGTDLHCKSMSPVLEAHLSISITSNNPISARNFIAENIYNNIQMNDRHCSRLLKFFLLYDPFMTVHKIMDSIAGTIC